MTQQDRDRLVALKKAKKGLITQRQAAEEIGQSERHVRRLLKRLKGKGDGALVHALRGRQSNRRLDEKTKQKALEILSRDVYRGFGPTLAAEYLDSQHDIHAGRETVRTWMIEGKLWRASRQRYDKIHPWRPRRSRVGEMVQWDTSEHAWLEDRGPKLYLISMIDDASSRLHARFVLHDSTAENMRLLWSYLERHGRPVSYYTDKAGLFVTGAEDDAARRGTGAPRARSFAADADRASASGIRYRVDRGPFPPSQRPRGTQFPDGAGPSGERSAGGRCKKLGASQCLLGSGIPGLVGPDAGRGSGQQRRCASALSPGALTGCFLELRREPAGQPWLYDSVRQPDLPDCAQRNSSGPARSSSTGRDAAGRFHGRAFRPALPDSHRLPTAPQSAPAESSQRPYAQACRASCQKLLDEELSTNQPGQISAVLHRYSVPGRRQKTPR